MIVVSDTGPINYLVLLGVASVLTKLYGEVWVPEAVLQELLHPDTPALVRAFATRPPLYLRVHSTTNDQEFASPLDLGEREAFALAAHLSADLLLMDDRAARQLAAAQGLRFTGTLGVLLEAARHDLLDLEINLNRLQKTSFRAGADVYERVRQEYSASRTP